MANIKELPLVVLIRILTYAAERRIGYIDLWSTNIPLLSVCRLWTRVLHSRVCSSAFITYISPRCYKYGGFTGWQNNIDFIIKRGWHRQVKRLQIRIYEAVHGLDVLSVLENVLQLDLIDWHGIKELAIVVENPKIGSKSPVPEELNRRIGVFARKLALKMPSVIGLDVIDIIRPYYLLPVLPVLTNAYHMQLRLLNMQPSAPLLAPHIGSQLTYLDVYLLDSDTTIPSIYADSLQILNLKNVPSDFSWHAFYNGSGSGVIEFKSLQKLFIAFQSTSKPFQNQNVELRFSVLKTLQMRNCPASCNILSAKFDQPLELFSLGDNIMHVEVWSRVSLKSNCFLVISDELRSTTQAEFVRITNILFGTPMNCQRRNLMLNCRFNSIEYTALSWTYLDSLTSLKSIGLETLLKLVSRLPRLSVLSTNIELHSPRNCLESVNQLFHEYLDDLPFDLNFRELAIQWSSGGISNSMVIAIIYNFIVRSDLLKKLRIPRCLKADVNAIINALKLRYPHLARVKVVGVAESLSTLSFFHTRVK